MSIQITVGNKIKTFREKKGWSQEDLADISGLHRTYISGVERGVRNPTIEIVFRISCALGVDVAQLFEQTPKSGKSE